MDGVQIGTSDSSSFTVENLENDVEYCFEITTAYEEGESSPSVEVCSTPRGPFQVSPLSISSEELMTGQYVEYDLMIANFDTTHIDFDISSIVHSLRIKQIFFKSLVLFAFFEIKFFFYL